MTQDLLRLQLHMANGTNSSSCARPAGSMIVKALGTGASPRGSRKTTAMRTGARTAQASWCHQRATRARVRARGWSSTSTRATVRRPSSSSSKSPSGSVVRATSSGERTRGRGLGAEQQAAACRAGAPSWRPSRRCRCPGGPCWANLAIETDISVRSVIGFAGGGRAFAARSVGWPRRLRAVQDEAKAEAKPVRHGDGAVPGRRARRSTRRSWRSCSATSWGRTGSWPTCRPCGASSTGATTGRRAWGSASPTATGRPSGDRARGWPAGRGPGPHVHLRRVPRPERALAPPRRGLLRRPPRAGSARSHQRLAGVALSPPRAPPSLLCMDIPIQTREDLLGYALIAATLVAAADDGPIVVGLLGAVGGHLSRDLPPGRPAAGPRLAAPLAGGRARLPPPLPVPVLGAPRPGAERPAPLARGARGGSTRS